MSILRNFFKSNSSANIAKERLKIVISHENNANLSLLPKLRHEIMQVLKKHINNVNEDQVDIRLDQQQCHSTLELNVTFPSHA